MPQIIIDNPILNSPFDEPTRHFRFDEQGITNDIVETRCGFKSRTGRELEGRTWSQLPDEPRTT